MENSKIIDLPQNPFGGVDEQAATDMFEEAVGGVKKAEQMMGLWNNTFKTDMRPQGRLHTKEELFRTKAITEGFKDEHVDLFLALP